MKSIDFEIEKQGPGISVSDAAIVCIGDEIAAISIGIDAEEQFAIAYVGSGNNGSPPMIGIYPGSQRLTHCNDTKIIISDRKFKGWTIFASEAQRDWIAVCLVKTLLPDGWPIDPIPWER